MATCPARIGSCLCPCGRSPKRRLATPSCRQSSFLFTGMLPGASTPPFTQQERLEESGAVTRRPVVGAGHLPWGEGMGLPGLAVRGYVICLQEVAPYPVTCPTLSPLAGRNRPGPVCAAQGGQGLENQQVVLGHTSDSSPARSCPCKKATGRPGCWHFTASTLPHRGGSPSTTGWEPATR